MRGVICMVIGCLFVTAVAETEPQTIEWPAYGGGPGGGHYTSATQISRDNLDQLALTWSHRSGSWR